MAQQWREEFGDDYAVPALIDRLIDAGRLMDLSWHNDVCPSVCLPPGAAGPDERTPRLWMDHPDPNMRETGPDGTRYNVMSAHGVTDYITTDDEIVCFPTDDLREALRKLGVSAEDIERYADPVPVAPQASDLWMVETLNDAASILRLAPFSYTSVTVDFPGVLIVGITNGDGTERLYITGHANETYTVDYYASSAQYEMGDRTTDSGTTGLPVSRHTDGWRLAIQLAALIDRMENAH